MLSSFSLPPPNSPDWTPMTFSIRAASWDRSSISTRKSIHAKVWSRRSARTSSRYVGTSTRSSSRRSPWTKRTSGCTSWTMIMNFGSRSHRRSARKVLFQSPHYPLVLSKGLLFVFRSWYSFLSCSRYSFLGFYSLWIPFWNSRYSYFVLFLVSFLFFSSSTSRHPFNVSGLFLQIRTD